MAETIKVSSPAELVAAASYVLGFEPKESLVVLTVSGYGPAARVDLPADPAALEEAMSVLTDAYRKFPNAQVMALAFTEDRMRGTAAASSLQTGLRSVGVEALDAVWSDGTSWEQPGIAAGGVAETDRDRIGAPLVAAGCRRPAESREARRSELLEGRDTSGVAAALEKRKGGGQPHPADEARWLTLTAAERRPLTDEEVARAVHAVSSGPGRDALYGEMSLEGARHASEMWAEVTARTPEESRPMAAVPWGLNAYLAGDGAQAWMAVDEMPANHAIRDMVELALTEALPPPKVWELYQPMLSNKGVYRATPAADFPLPPPPAPPAGPTL